MKKQNKKNKEVVLNQAFLFQRPIGYVPQGYFKTEYEIRHLCDKSNILVSEIIKFEGYKVIGREIKNRKKYNSMKKAIDSKVDGVEL